MRHHSRVLLQPSASSLDLTGYARARVSEEVQRGAFSSLRLICHVVSSLLSHWVVHQCVVRAVPGPKRNCSLGEQPIAFVEAEVVVSNFHLIARSTRTIVGEYRPVLMLDCVASHVTQGVMETAAHCRLELLYVPPGATGVVVQPLRCYAAEPFFKAYLRQRFQLQRTYPTASRKILNGCGTCLNVPGWYRFLYMQPILGNIFPGRWRYVRNVGL